MVTKRLLVIVRGHWSEDQKWVVSAAVVFAEEFRGCNRSLVKQSVGP